MATEYELKVLELYSKPELSRGELTRTGKKEHLANEGVKGAAAEAILRELYGPEPGSEPDVPFNGAHVNGANVEGPIIETVQKPLIPPQVNSTMTQKEHARAQGYTGDACDMCGGFTMKRAGTCLTCASCGATSGCG